MTLTMRALRLIRIGLVLGGFVLVFGSCTASQLHLSVAVDDVPGFWKGLWHGFIAPVSFLVSLMSSEVRIYGFPNSGRWYDLGFMLGIGGFSGGLFAGARSRPRDK